MTPDTRRRRQNSFTEGSQTRRRFLQIAGLGSVGVAGCLRDGAEENEPATSDLSTLIATWRGHDPTNSVTLQWLTSADDRSDPVPVEVLTESGNAGSMEQTNVALFGDSDLSRHRAVLTGLESDTSYNITIDGFNTDLSVQTAPEEITESLTFAEGGDIGTSSDVPLLHQQVASWDPLFGLVGGDLAYADGRDVGKWITFLEHWNEYMRSDDRLIPLVAAIGDHELREREFHGTPDDAPFFYSMFDNSQQERAYWTLDIGDDLSIVILDSNHTVEVAGTQTEWLEETLAERIDRDHLLAAYHIPAYPSSKPIEDEEREDVRQYWVPLFEEYNVDVSFEHDDHAYKRTHLLRDGEPDPDDGILYLGDGAWGRGPREVSSPEERPYLAVSESKLHVIRADLAPGGSSQFRAVDRNGDTIDRFDGTGTPLQNRLVTNAVR